MTNARLRGICRKRRHEERRYYVTRPPASPVDARLAAAPRADDSPRPRRTMLFTAEQNALERLESGSTGLKSGHVSSRRA
jgi:hypothetical protein